MASGQTVRLVGDRQRALACQLVAKAPAGAVVNIREATRTTDQNAMLWSLLSDVARAKPDGRVLPAEIWKCVFMAACGHQVRFEPTLEGDGVIPIGFRSSRLNKAEMSDLLEFILAFGAERGVKFSDEINEQAR